MTGDYGADASGARFICGVTVIAAAVLVCGCAGAHPAARARGPQALAGPGGQRQASAASEEPRALTGQLAGTGAAARAFFSAYLPYLDGRASADAVPGISGQVRAKLQRARARITPAERAAQPRLARLALTATGPPTSILARATITAGPGAAPSTLTITLEPRHGRWLIIALGG
jgi:hypothetical protein